MQQYLTELDRPCRDLALRAERLSTDMSASQGYLTTFLDTVPIEALLCTDVPKGASTQQGCCLLMAETSRLAA